MNSEVPALLRRRRDNLHRAPAAQEVRDGLKRAHRGRQPDTLEFTGDLRQAFQGQREVHAALRASKRVNLIDDDGIHAL